MRLDLGIDPKNLLAVSVWPDQRVHPLQRGAYHAFEPALEATRSVPGVKQAGAALGAPLMGGACWSFVQPNPTSAPMRVDCNTVDGAYFGALGIALRAGRVFTLQDTDRSASVVVVNESLARMLYPAGGAVGRPLGYSTKPSIIVGVVADVRNRLLFPPGPEVYRPATQVGGLFMPTLVVRYEEAGKANVNALIRQRLSALDPNSIIRIRSFEEAIAQQGLQTRFLTALIAGARRAGPAAGGERRVRRHGLWGEPPHARAGRAHSHRRRAGRRVAHDRARSHCHGRRRGRYRHSGGLRPEQRASQSAVRSAARRSRSRC